MKNRLATGLVLAALAISGTDAFSSPAIPRDEALEKRVQDILAGMSLKDKVGQMCEIEVSLVLDDKPDKKGLPVLNEAKLKTAFDEYRVGSVLNTPQGHAQDRFTWYNIINGIQKASMKYIGIPDVFGVDQNHGTTYTEGGILFPQEINMAASFNRELVREAARITAYESRAASIPWVYNPVMDLGRTQVWSRIWESFGEDPFINGVMSVEMVKGYQGSDPNHLGPLNVGSCLKHYMGYGSPVSGKDRTPTSINPVDLREKYFHPFKEAIRAGALSVMVNSGVNNGLPMHANYEILTEWLKNDLEWDGMIVTDWADIHNLWRRDHIAADYKEAIMLSINAGVDMSMTPYDSEFATLLKELVEEGKVPIERIDDAVARIIRFKLRLGLFEKPVTKPEDYPLFGSKEHSDKALELAVQSEVLLKNRNVLPIAKGKKILLTGPNANSMRCLNGGWSYTWQGSADSRYHEQYNTIYEAFCNVYGAENVVLSKGLDYVEADMRWQEEENIDFEKVVQDAAGVDVIVACIGENSYCETPGNINDLNLSENQKELVRRLAATGKPIVLVLNSGRPRLIREIEPLAAGVIDILLPGNYGGDALALLVSGERNFSAKLPFTYPKWINGLNTYDHKPMESVPTMEGAYNYDASIDVQWPFASGLSYTDYKYSDITIDKTEFTPEDNITVSVTLSNVGSVKGMEPVILFSTDLVASITPDVKRVRGFDKIELLPGQSEKVSFTIPASDLAFVGYDGKWILEKGEFEFTIGTCKLKARCLETKKWDSPNI